MASYPGLLAALDALFASVADDPTGCGEEMLGAWLQETLGGLEPPVDRALARELRRAARLAGRMAKYWSDPERAGRLPADWRQAVDAALGSTGWAPSLEVARIGLDREPSPTLFAEVSRRWPLVHFAPWQEGLTYEEWLAGR
jgi:hypothetical protein